jgi:hypothetical protein
MTNAKVFAFVSSAGLPAALPGGRVRAKSQTPASLQAREALNTLATFDLSPVSFRNALSAATASGRRTAPPAVPLVGYAKTAQPPSLPQVGMPSSHRAELCLHSPILTRYAHPLAFALPPAPLPPPQTPTGTPLPSPHTQQGSSNLGGRSQGKLREGLGLGAQRRSGSPCTSATGDRVASQTAGIHSGGCGGSLLSAKITSVEIERMSYVLPSFF